MKEQILPEQIEAFLTPEASGLSVTVRETVDSTNTILMQAGANQAPEGTVLLALHQTQGRGRRGRSFYSPSSGLYCSILLRPSLAADEMVRITTMAAVAVCEAIEQQFGLSPEIKWVNDLLLNGKKICGILTEAVFASDHPTYAVLGIGLNLCPPEGGFPEALRDIAGSLLPELPAAEQICRFTAALLSRFWYWYRHPDTGAYLSHYRRRCMVLGTQIQVLPVGGVPYWATACLIDEECRLLVETEDGEKRLLSSGEISIRPK